MSGYTGNFSQLNMSWMALNRKRMGVLNSSGFCLTDWQANTCGHQLSDTVRAHLLTHLIQNGRCTANVHRSQPLDKILPPASVRLAWSSRLLQSRENVTRSKTSNPSICRGNITSEDRLTTKHRLCCSSFFHRCGGSFAAASCSG